MSGSAAAPFPISDHGEPHASIAHQASRRLAETREKSERNTTNSPYPCSRYLNRVKDPQITYPDQVWIPEITYIRLRQESFYLSISIGVYVRAIWDGV
jgi:hypothetical protein